ILVQQWSGSLREDRVNPGGTTALPGTLDQVTHRGGSQRAILKEALPRRHGLSVVIRLRKACEMLRAWHTVSSKREVWRGWSYALAYQKTRETSMETMIPCWWTAWCPSPCHRLGHPGGPRACPRGVARVPAGRVRRRSALLLPA